MVDGFFRLIGGKLPFQEAEAEAAARRTQTALQAAEPVAQQQYEDSLLGWGQQALSGLGQARDRLLEQALAPIQQHLSAASGQLTDTLNQASTGAAGFLNQGAAGIRQTVEQAAAPETQAAITAQLAQPSGVQTFVAERSPAFRGALESEREGAQIGQQLQDVGLPSGVAQPAGAALGVLGAIPRGFGESVEAAARTFGAPEPVAEVAGQVGEVLAPIPGDRFGALTRGRLAATGAGALAGAGAGAVLGDEQAPGGRVGEALKGAAIGAQLGAPGLDVAQAAGRAAGAAGRTRVGQAVGEVAQDYAARSRRLGITPEAFGAEVPTARPAAAAAAAAPVPAAPAAAAGEAAEEVVGADLDRILASQQQGRRPLPPSTEIEQVVNSLGTRVAMAAFDAGASLQRVQETVYRRLGRAPTVAEDAYLQLRLFAGRAGAAAQRVKDDLLPAVQQVPEPDRPLLNAYLTAADNADKAAAVGQRVQAAALGGPVPGALARAKARRYLEYVRGREGAAGQRGVAQLATRWDTLQERLGRVETELATLAERPAIPSPPPSWRGVGRHRLSDADLQALAERMGVNPYAPSWWDQIDAETVRLYRREALAERGPGPSPDATTRAAARQQAVALRKEARTLRKQAKQLDTAIMRRLAVAGRRDDVLARALAGVGEREAAAESRLLERAAVRGAEAEAGRRFSGDVRAHPLAQVQATFVRRYGPFRAQRLFDAAEGVWQFTRGLRAQLHDSGAISDEVYAAWERDFPHYARTDILDFLPDPNGAGPGAQAVATGRPVLTVADLGIRRLSTEGTTRARDLPLNSVIRQTFATESLVRRNRGAQAVLRMIEQDPELGRLIRPVKADHTLTSDQAYFSVLVKGEQHRYVGPKALVDGLTRFQPEQVGDLVRVGAALSGAPILRAGATGWNALFIPVNLLRDARQFLIRTGALAGDVRKTGRSVGELARAYWDSFVRGDSTPDLAAMQRAGAGQAHEFFNLAPEAILRRLMKEGLLGGRVRPVTSKADFLGAVSDVFALPFTPIRAIGERVERAPRLAEFRLARREGEAVERQALRARDITMDFARGGTWAKVINRVIPFFNVAVQSPERFVTLDLAKGRRLQTGISLVTGVLAPALVAEAWNRSQYPEDYANVPDYLKDTGLVIMLPITPKGQPSARTPDGTPSVPDGTPGQRPYLWLPLPQQYAFLKIVQDQALAAALGDDSRGWGDVLTSVLEGQVPVGTEAELLPPTLRTAAELRANYDFFRDRPIVPERLANLPPGERVTPRTSALGRAIGGALNVAPPKVDYAVTSLAGGVGRQLLAGSDIVARAFGWPAAEPGASEAIDLPVVGGLVGRVVRTAGGQRERDARRALDREKAALIKEQLRLLEQDQAFQRATPAEQAEFKRRLANRIDARFTKRYQALQEGVPGAAGQGAQGGRLSDLFMEPAS